MLAYLEMVGTVFLTLLYQTWSLGYFGQLMIFLFSVQSHLMSPDKNATKSVTRYKTYLGKTQKIQDITVIAQDQKDQTGFKD